MRIRLLFLLSFFCLSEHIMWGRSVEAGSEVVNDSTLTVPDFSDAFKKGDVRTLAKFFHSTIELVMPSKSRANYAKAQAEQIIQKFFDENEPSNFIQTHQINRENDECTLATLYTDQGKFRITIRMRPAEEVYHIFSIRIEDDND